mmetsp:Transcript_53203/g.116085  ORF Transcript_53203/g.116085 Transcript_53203/m.116085 type:complete len:209 (-) Transcript_53203:367-993(-)
MQWCNAFRIFLSLWLGSACAFNNSSTTSFRFAKIATLNGDRPNLSSPAEVSALAFSKCRTKAALPAIVAVKSGFCPSLSRPFCGSAPAFNKASAVFQAAIVIAALNAERPAASSTVALALCARSEEMANWLRWSTASSNGARPLASVPWLGFAPSFSSFVKTSAGAEKFKASKTKDPSCFAEGASVKRAPARANSMMSSVGWYLETTA